MNTKKSLKSQNQFYQQTNDFYTFSNDVQNWKTVLYIHSKKKEIGLKEIEYYLRKYFSNHHDSIDKSMFEKILQNANILIDKNSLEFLWNSCQPNEQGISYENFCQRFTSFQLENNQNLNEKNSTINQPHILNYITSIDHIIKKHWQNLKKDFTSLDQYGRLFITIDQAINLMKKYNFPLNDKQQCELIIYFSPKNNGQFNYFDFMKYFIHRSSSKNFNQNNSFRSKYFLQSKQSWTNSPINIDSIFNRIRIESINKYESIHRMFEKLDKNHQKYLTKIQFNQLLEQFDVYLNDEDFYHVLSEIDKKQDGFISYNELYYSLIIDSLQI